MTASLPRTWRTIVPAVVAVAGMAALVAGLCWVAWRERNLQGDRDGDRPSTAGGQAACEETADPAALANQHASVARPTPLRDLAARELEAAAAWLADLCSSIAESCEDRGPLARMARQQALRVLRCVLAADHWRVADARLALDYFELLARLDAEQRRQLAEAEESERQAIRLYHEGRRADALAPALKTAQLRQQVLGAEHPQSAVAMNNLALVCQALGDYAQAERLFQRALAVNRKLLGGKHPTTARNLNNLALLCEATGDYLQAESLYHDSLAITTAALGPSDPSVASSLNNLAMLNKTLGNYAEAERLCLAALAIQQKKLGDAHPDTLTSLNNLGQVYAARGDYGRAQPLCEHVLQQRRKLLGDGRLDTATSRNNLADVYIALGDFVRAEPLLREALQTSREAVGEKSPRTAVALSNLAALHVLQEAYAKAEPLYQAALEIERQAAGDESLACAAIKGRLAGLYAGLGNYIRAEALYREVLAVRRKLLGPSHPETADSIANLAALLASRGDAVGAEPLYREAVEIRRAVLGDQHLDTAAARKNLGALYDATQRRARAERLLEESLCAYERHADAVLPYIAPRQQLQLLRWLRSALDAYLSLGTRRRLAEERVYQHLLAWKGAALARQRRTRLAATRPELAGPLAELQRVSARIASLALAAVDPAGRDPRQRQLDALSNRKEQLERELARRSAEFQRESKPVDAGQLAASLPAGAALVDLLEYEYLAEVPQRAVFTAEPRLLAMVVRADRPIVRVELGPLAPIERAIAAWRASLARAEDESIAAAQLRDLLWRPIEEHLAGVDTVLLSPDGATARLSWAALPGKKPGSYLIEEVTIAVVPVPRLLPEMLAPREADRDRAGGAGRLLLVGDVDYEADLPGPPAAAIGPAGAESAAMKFSPLPNTGRELASVRDCFARSVAAAGATPQIDELRQADASADMFRRRAPGCRYLHLATHGFFAPKAVRSALMIPATRQPGDGPLTPLAQPRWDWLHPGLLSGIALAGANRPHGPDSPGGILTAEEVATLDFSSMDLAVLSACETALGETSAGEGLLGLQRAFQVAGARSVVASLWNVEDQATRLLMERFYENLWQRKLPKAQSLREAQLWLLHRPSQVRGDGADDSSPDASQRLSPLLWAAFVLSGDWR
jgi:CHAT domain-containing protein